MSRLFPDRLLVSLAPQGMALLRMSGGLRPRVLQSAARGCDPEFGSARWHGALAALRAAAGPLQNERLDATVVLSNHFVRYALVPWSEELDGAEEELAFARHVFANTYGERAKTWEIRLSEDAPGAPRLASALEPALLEELRDCFSETGRIRLASVQPFLMSAFNLWRRRLGSDSDWLLVGEPGRACLARFAKGRWAAARNARLNGEGPEEYVTLLERERHAAAGEAAGSVLIYSSGAKVPDRGGEWKFAPLEISPGIEARSDPRYALALTAI